MHARFSLLAVAVFLAAASPGWADFQDGMRALQRGDYETSYRELLPLARQGNPDAQFVIGDMYRTGRGVSQSYSEAARWFQQAAEQGNGRAQHALGQLFKDGLGVARDDAAALIWYRRAAEQRVP